MIVDGAVVVAVLVVVSALACSMTGAVVNFSSDLRCGRFSVLSFSLTFARGWARAVVEGS